jgi:hypothetical protein
MSGAARAHALAGGLPMMNSAHVSQDPDSPAEIAHIRRTLSLSVTIGLLVCSLGIVVFTMYLAIPQIRPVISSTIPLIATLAGIYGAYYAGAALERNLRHARQRVSIELDGFIMRNLEIVQLRTLLDDAELRKIPPEEIYAKIKADVELFTITRILLNHLEVISVSIQLHAADERVLFYSMRSTLLFYRRHLSIYINEFRGSRRQTTGYIELEKLADAWSKNESLVTGEVWPTKTIKPYRNR